MVIINCLYVCQSVLVLLCQTSRPGIIGEHIGVIMAVYVIRKSLCDVAILKYVYSNFKI